MAKLRKDDWKLAFILIAQLLALIEICVLQFLANNCSANSYGQMDMVDIAIFLSVVYSLAVGLFSRVGLGIRNSIVRIFSKMFRSVNCEMPMKEYDESNFVFFDMKNGVRFLAISNLIVLGFCVTETGGSEASFFSPFLLSVVITIVIVKAYTQVELIFWIVLTALVFAFSWFYFKPLETIKGKEHLFGLCLLASFLTCWIFPLLFFVLDRKTFKASKLANDENHNDSDTII